MVSYVADQHGLRHVLDHTRERTVCGCVIDFDRFLDGGCDDCPEGPFVSCDGSSSCLSCFEAIQEIKESLKAVRFRPRRYRFKPGKSNNES